MMRSLVLIKGDRATILHVRHHHVTIFNPDRRSAIREPAGPILWIDGYRSRAICEDGF